MITVLVKVDPRLAVGYLNSVQERQYPYAVSLGLNRIANAAQEAVRDHIRTAFHLRRESWVLKGIKIEKADRATKSSWSVTIQVAEAYDYLRRMEDGQTKMPKAGRGRLWQPNEQVFKSKVIGISNPLHPKNLKLQMNAKGQIQGQQRAFLVKTGNGQTLILQRQDRNLTTRSRRALSSLSLDNVHTGIGPRHKKQKAIHRDNGTRTLYRLVKRIKVPAKLQFVKTVKATIERSFQDTMGQAMDEALRGAR